MAPPGKTADGRRKSGGKPSLLVTLTVPASPLRELLKSNSPKEDTPSVRDFSGLKDAKDSPTASSNSAAQAHSNGEPSLESATDTPAAEGTPAPSLMGPPTDGRKKKGIKRSAAAAANGTQDGTPRPRGKPGPKKKPRLEDGTIDHSGVSSRPAGAHKLGPKANQGAINAGLRALDRSGKHCRRWCRGGFKLKSFTGVVWEVSRWNAPPKKETESANDDSGAPSADNSGCKENKENEAEPMSGSNSSSGADVDMTSANASPTAPMAVTMAA